MAPTFPVADLMVYDYGRRCSLSRLHPSPPALLPRKPSVRNFLWNSRPEKALLVPRNKLSLSLRQLRIINLTFYPGNKQDCHRVWSSTMPVVSLLVCTFEFFFSIILPSIPVCLSRIDFLYVVFSWRERRIYVFLPHLPRASYLSGTESSTGHSHSEVHVSDPQMSYWMLGNRYNQTIAMLYDTRHNGEQYKVVRREGGERIVSWEHQERDEAKGELN